MNLQNYCRLWSFFAGHKKWIAFSILLSLLMTVKIGRASCRERLCLYV